jgi:hypothetical protein
MEISWLSSFGQLNGSMVATERLRPEDVGEGDPGALVISILGEDVLALAGMIGIELESLVADVLRDSALLLAAALVNAPVPRALELSKFAGLLNITVLLEAPVTVWLSGTTTVAVRTMSLVITSVL